MSAAGQHPLPGRDQIRALIPHAGDMSLLDAVLHWDDDSIHCRAVSHRDPRHPLRADAQLSAIHLIEYGAQAMALHGGLLAQAHGERAKPGVLVGVREVNLHVARIDDVADDLDVRATRRVGGDRGWLYDFEVHAAGRSLARGRVSVIPVGDT